MGRLQVFDVNREQHIFSGESPFHRFARRGARRCEFCISHWAAMIGSSGGWVGLRFFLKKGEHIFADRGSNGSLTAVIC